MKKFKFKQQVLQMGIPKLANQISKALYAHSVKSTYGVELKSVLTFEEAMELHCYLMENYPEEYAEAKRINAAHYKRTCRLRKRIENMLTNYPTVVFVTLTFTNEVLASTTAETRRQYVQRFLKETGSIYVANRHFATTTGREHYHGLVGCKINSQKWGYGLINFEYVQESGAYQNLLFEEAYEKAQKEHIARLAKYIAKLSNNEIEHTGNRSYCIYSRNKSS